MKAMIAYSIKADETLALRAFSSKRAAMRWGNGQHIFANIDELANSRVTSEDARRVYHAVTGKMINVSERQLLSEMLFNAIQASKLPLVDKDEVEMSIVCQPIEPVVAQQPIEKKVVVSKPDKVKEEKVMSEHIAAETKTSEELLQKKDRKFARSPRNGTTDPLEAFGVHPDSNRAKALSRMEKKLGQQVPQEELVIAVYGSNEKKNVSSFAMVMKGLFAIQAGNDLSIEIRKEKTERGISYGLYVK